MSRLHETSGTKPSFGLALVPALLLTVAWAWTAPATANAQTVHPAIATTHTDTKCAANGVCESVTNAARGSDHVDSVYVWDRSTSYQSFGLFIQNPAAPPSQRGQKSGAGGVTFPVHYSVDRGKCAVGIAASVGTGPCWIAPQRDALSDLTARHHDLLEVTGGIGRPLRLQLLLKERR